jgi:hypothetical protein
MWEIIMISLCRCIIMYTMYAGKKSPRYYNAWESPLKEIHYNTKGIVSECRLHYNCIVATVWHIQLKIVHIHQTSPSLTCLSEFFFNPHSGHHSDSAPHNCKSSLEATHRTCPIAVIYVHCNIGAQRHRQECTSELYCTLAMPTMSPPVNP